MGKIKSFGHDLSLRKSLVLYAAAFVAIALTLSLGTVSLCSRIIDSIYSAYPQVGEKYYLTNAQGERLGEGVMMGKQPVLLSEQDEKTIAALQLISVAAAPVYSALCIVAAALVFYHNKLKKPLGQLREALENISADNLDFRVDYVSQDELGQLCASFETMRAALADNLSAMWRQVEDRRQLNAAFAHELRTPLTVLKGYHEMLRGGDSMQAQKIAATMEKQLNRMEAYIGSMSRLQRLEDAQPDIKPTAWPPLFTTLVQSAEIICAQQGKTLAVRQTLTAAELNLDSTFVSQVCGNLIANAARYAKTTVCLTFALQDNGLLLTVKDDGKGFNPECLDQLTRPYFTEERGGDHFGLGLTLSKLLCERHGGSLKLDNLPDGAQVRAFFRFP